MRRNVTAGCSVYAAADGTVAFLDTPDSVIPPPFIAHLTYLGPPCDVVTEAVNRLHGQQRAAGARPAAQQALAGLLGTRQQYVSRWVNGQQAPVLSDGQWATLVHLATGDVEETRRPAHSPSGELPAFVKTGPVSGTVARHPGAR